MTNVLYRRSQSYSTPPVCRKSRSPVIPDDDFVDLKIYAVAPDPSNPDFLEFIGNLTIADDNLNPTAMLFLTWSNLVFGLPSAMQNNTTATAGLHTSDPSLVVKLSYTDGTSYVKVFYFDLPALARQGGAQ